MWSRLRVATRRSPALAGVSPWNIEEAAIGRGDVMLGEIAFDHPLFASLAGAQFNDFTKIRFWKYRRIDADSAGRIARAGAVREWRCRHHRETHGQRKARRAGERLAAGRQPARPVVEVRAAHVGTSGAAELRGR